MPEHLWPQTPGMCQEIPTITAYVPEEKRSDGAVVIFPGGAYRMRAPHEGEGYARFLAGNGITAFVVDYRVAPHKFPLPLLDARRAVRWVRVHAGAYGIAKDRVAVMGSSAGGHLAALVSTYRGKLAFEGLDAIDEEAYLPNAQILCYPVILRPGEEGVSHAGCYRTLLEESTPEWDVQVEPCGIADEKTPPAFLWHTAGDGGVNVINSYRYAEALRRLEVPVEMHIFPYGRHGLGLAEEDPHVVQWGGLLINWLKMMDWLK